MHHYHECFGLDAKAKPDFAVTMLSATAPGNVFHEGEQPQFTFQLENLSDQPLKIDRPRGRHSLRPAHVPGRPVASRPGPPGDARTRAARRGPGAEAVDEPHHLAADAGDERRIRTGRGPGAAWPGLSDQLRADLPPGARAGPIPQAVAGRDARADSRTAGRPGDSLGRVVLPIRHARVSAAVGAGHARAAGVPRPQGDGRGRSRRREPGPAAGPRPAAPRRAGLHAGTHQGRPGLAARAGRRLPGVLLPPGDRVRLAQGADHRHQAVERAVGRAVDLRLGRRHGALSRAVQADGPGRVSGSPGGRRGRARSAAAIPRPTPWTSCSATTGTSGCRTWTSVRSITRA